MAKKNVAHVGVVECGRSMATRCINIWEETPVTTSNFPRRQHVSESPLEGSVQEDKANAHQMPFRRTPTKTWFSYATQSGDSIFGSLPILLFFFWTCLAVGTLYSGALCYKWGAKHRTSPANEWIKIANKIESESGICVRQKIQITKAWNSCQNFSFHPSPPPVNRGQGTSELLLVATFDCIGFLSESYNHLPIEPHLDILVHEPEGNRIYIDLSWSHRFFSLQNWDSEFLIYRKYNIRRSL